MSRFLGCLKFCFNLVVLLVEAVLWIFQIVFWLGRIIRDCLHARASMADDELHCPRGHVIPLRGQVYECSACGWTYEGELLRCMNPECSSPDTSFINCPECGLSVRNPYRYGGQ
jgi:rubredoxin